MGVFANVPLIVDTSALTRWRQASAQTHKRFREALEAGELVTSPVVRLEFLHDAFDRAVFNQRMRLFAVYPREIDLDASDGSKAVQAMYDLAHLEPEKTGYHKVKLADALIAASAVREGVGVLHFDKHFRRLAEVMPNLLQIPIEPL